MSKKTKSTEKEAKMPLPKPVEPKSTVEAAPQYSSYLEKMLIDENFTNALKQVEEAEKKAQDLPCVIDSFVFKEIDVQKMKNGSRPLNEAYSVEMYELSSKMKDEKEDVSLQLLNLETIACVCGDGSQFSVALKALEKIILNKNFNQNAILMATAYFHFSDILEKSIKLLGLERNNFKTWVQELLNTAAEICTKADYCIEALALQTRINFSLHNSKDDNSKVQESLHLHSIRCQEIWDYPMMLAYSIEYTIKAGSEYFEEKSSLLQVAVDNWMEAINILQQRYIKRNREMSNELQFHLSEALFAGANANLQLLKIHKDPNLIKKCMELVEKAVKIVSQLTHYGAADIKARATEKLIKLTEKLMKYCANSQALTCLNLAKSLDSQNKEEIRTLLEKLDGSSASKKKTKKSEKSRQSLPLSTSSAASVDDLKLADVIDTPPEPKQPTLQQAQKSPESAEIKLLRAKIERMEKEHKTKQANQKADRDRDVGRLETKLHESDSRLDEAAKGKKIEEQKASDLLTQINKLKEEIQAEKTQRSTLEKRSLLEISNLVKEQENTERLNSELAALQRKLSTQNTRIEAMTKEIKDIISTQAKALSSKEMELAAYQKQLENLNADLLKGKPHTEVMAKQLSENAEEISRLKSIIDHQKKEISSKDRVLHASQTQLASTKTEILEKKAQIDEITAKVNQLKGAVATQEKLLCSKDKALATLQGNLKLEKFQAEMAIAQIEQVEAHAMECIQESKGELYRQSAEAQESYHQLMCTTNQQLEDQAGYIAILRRDLSNLHSENAQLSGELGKVQARNRLLEAQAQQSSARGASPAMFGISLTSSPSK